MKPLICPQCGGSISNYSKLDNFANCGYCATKFVIEAEKPKPAFQPAPVFDSPAATPANPNLFIAVLFAVSLVFGGIILLAISLSKNNKKDYPVYATPYSKPTPRITPTPTPNPNLLEFGARGTDNGRFQDADAITVDRQGRIYVADGTLRVQQFKENGEFLKVWQIPSETKYYDRARSIQKIAVNDQNQLYVLIGGVVLIYENTSSKPLKVIHFAPNAIQDFALRSDGERLFIVNDDKIETLFYISDKGKTVKKIAGFHTKTADAALAPYETGLAAIRLAVDGAGNIFSVYAFGDLGSYTLNYNTEELMIFRFTPEGKYVNKFVQSMKSCGIEVDNQSRLYVSDDDSISAYSNNGEPVSTVTGLGSVDAFALDKQNNIYVVKNDQVFKRPAIQ